MLAATSGVVIEARHLQRRLAVLCYKFQASRLRHAELSRRLLHRVHPRAAMPRRTAGDVPIYAFARTAAGGARMVRRPLFAGGSEDAGPNRRGGAIRVLVAAGPALARHALRSVLEHEPGIEAVGEAEDEEQGVRRAATLAADILVVLKSDEQGGIAINLVAARRPVKVLTLRDGTQPPVATRLVQPSGADVPVDITPMTIGDAVRAMHTGRLGPYIDTRLLGESARAHVSTDGAASRRLSGDLTAREREILGGVAQGLSDKEIAAKLFLSESTVKTHLKVLYRRFQFRNRAHAAVAAYEQGLLKH